jgi:hypothetical protein
LIMFSSVRKKDLYIITVSSPSDKPHIYIVIYKFDIYVCITSSMSNKNTNSLLLHTLNLWHKRKESWSSSMLNKNTNSLRLHWIRHDQNRKIISTFFSFVSMI